MRWFKFHADLINDPTLHRLPGDKFKTWINLLCITSKHDGVLPPLMDLAFLLRPIGEDKIAALLEEFCERDCLIRLTCRAPRRDTRRAIGRHGSMLP